MSKEYVKVILFTIFWLVSVILLYYFSSEHPDSYNKIWTYGALSVTIIYGAVFYLTHLFSKEITTRFEKNVLYAANASFWLLALIIIASISRLLDFTRGSSIYIFLDRYAYLSLAIYFFMIDGMLYWHNPTKFNDEGWFVGFIDFPTMLGFILICIMGSFKTMNNIEYFLAGAHAFQLVAFNTSFTILLLYLMFFKKHEELGEAGR